MAYLSAHGRRCIAYDRRGHGRSVESAAGYEFNTLSDDLSAVMQQLDLQGVTLVAHSMGCGGLVRYFPLHGGRHASPVLHEGAPAASSCLYDPDFRPDLQTISLPTLITPGDCDTSTPLELTGRKTAALILGSQLKVYESAAHGLPVTHAERLKHDLLVFASS